MPAEPPAARRQQLALLDEVRGEEHDEQHLRRLAGLDVSGPMRAHSRAPLISTPTPGTSGSSERDDAEEEERVAVPGERADVAHDDQREHERGDADRGPDAWSVRRAARSGRGRAARS